MSNRSASAQEVAFLSLLNYTNNNDQRITLVHSSLSSHLIILLLLAGANSGFNVTTSSTAATSDRRWWSLSSSSSSPSPSLSNQTTFIHRQQWLPSISDIINTNNINGDHSQNFNTLERGEYDGQQREKRAGLGVESLAESCGFSIESHRVTTQDGYILTIHRLMNPLIGTKNLLGDPVILQHGIMCASPFFLINSSPELDRPRPVNTDFDTDNNSATTTNSSSSNSLAIELVQRGYDVWLPNLRGTQYSRSHLRRDLNEGAPNRSAYWDFNVDTLIEQDLRAYVDYVLDLTGKQRYMFIGHSLGATIGLGSLLVHRAPSRITRQLSCAVLMAPVASTQFMRGRLMSLFQMATMLYPELAPFPGDRPALSSFVRQMCPRLRQMCLWMANMFIGAKRIQASSSSPSATPLSAMAAASGGSSHNDDEQLDHEFLNQVNAFLIMMRQSVSVQMLQHIVQVHSSGRLSRFNYGRRTNVRRYGANNTRAPIYDLNKISEPQLKLAIVSGQSDAISTPGEVGWISEQVRDKVGHFEQITVPVTPFNHMDLIMSSEAGKFVNKRLLEFIQQNECLLPAASAASST